MHSYLDVLSDESISYGCNDSLTFTLTNVRLLQLYININLIELRKMLHNNVYSNQSPRNSQKGSGKASDRAWTSNNSWVVSCAHASFMINLKSSSPIYKIDSYNKIFNLELRHHLRLVNRTTVLRHQMRLSDPQPRYPGVLELEPS